MNRTDGKHIISALTKYMIKKNYNSISIFMFFFICLICLMFEKIRCKSTVLLSLAGKQHRAATILKEQKFSRSRAGADAASSP